MPITGLNIVGKGNNPNGTGTIRLENQEYIQYKEPGAATYGGATILTAADENKRVKLYGTDLKSYVIVSFASLAALPLATSTEDVACTDQFTHYVLKTPIAADGTGGAAIPEIRVQFVAADGERVTTGFPTTSFAQVFMSGAKVPKQVSFFLPVYDSTPDQPFAGTAVLWGQDASGNTIISEFTINLGVVPPAKTIQTFDVYGGVGVSSTRWRVKWKEPVAGVIVQSLFKEDESALETTMTSTASASNGNYYDFELSLAGKPQNLQAKLADSFVNASLQETYQVQYLEYLARPDLGNDIFDAVYQPYDKNLIITAVKSVFSPVIVLSGLAVKKSSQKRDQYLIAIENGLPITSEGMVYVMTANDEEGELAYSLLRSGATSNDLRGVGFSGAVAIQLIGMWYFQNDPARDQAVLEKAAFDKIATRSLGDVVQAIYDGWNGGMGTPGFQFPGLPNLLAGLRSKMTDDDRAGFLEYVTTNWS
jgi:hypothetical protein